MPFAVARQQIAVVTAEKSDSASSTSNFSDNQARTADNSLTTRSKSKQSKIKTESAPSAEKTDKRVITKRLWAEREAARSARDGQLNFVVAFDLAKASLLAERQLTKSAEQHVRADATSPAPHLAETLPR